MLAADRLDTAAREQLAAERLRHAEATSRITRGPDLAAEADRHLDRVNEIIRDHARRFATPGASLPATGRDTPPVH